MFDMPQIEMTIPHSGWPDYSKISKVVKEQPLTRIPGYLEIYGGKGIRRFIPSTTIERTIDVQETFSNFSIDNYEANALFDAMEKIEVYAEVEFIDSLLDD